MDYLNIVSKVFTGLVDEKSIIVLTIKNIIVKIKIKLIVLITLYVGPRKYSRIKSKFDNVNALELR